MNPFVLRVLFGAVYRAVYLAVHFACGWAASEKEILENTFLAVPHSGLWNMNQFMHIAKDEPSLPLALTRYLDGLSLEPPA